MFIKKIIFEGEMMFFVCQLLGNTNKNVIAKISMTATNKCVVQPEKVL